MIEIKMESYELTLPYPPSNNHYKGIIRNPKRPRISKRTGKPLMQFYLPKETERYHAEVAFRFKAQNGKPMLSKRLKVCIDVYAPQGKRGFDLDNIPKVVLDSLQKAGAYKNDSQIDCLIIARQWKYEDGMLIVKISSLE